MRVILIATMIIFLATLSQAEELNNCAPIEQKSEDFLEVARNNCQACHPDHHINQKKLLTGDITKEVPTTPGLMVEVQIDCMGCHIETTLDRKGEKVVKGSSKACVGCHTVLQETMVEQWKDTVREELEAVEEVKRKATDALKKAYHKVPEEMLSKAITMLEKGQEFVNVVKYGNGVHNKKYSITLIDFAFCYFEDVIDLVHGEEMEVSAQKE